MPALILCLTLFDGRPLAAQEAVIHGRVVNEAEEPLAYASVYAVGAVVSTTTNPDGEFELDVASGRVRLVVSYIGYENFDTTVVVAVADRKIDLAIVLTESFSKLGEVIVTGRRASGQAQALRLMQSAQSTQTIIHSEVFNKYPDVTLAETVSRMPGVSLIRDVNQGQIVQLRGLPEQYTGVALNGQRLPTIQPEDDQSGALDIIQSNLVDEVRIVKSRTAQTDADAIAGIVNFKIRQPEERFEVLAQAARGTNFGFDGNPDQFSGITQLTGSLNSEVSSEKVYFLAAGSLLREGRGVRTDLREYDADRRLAQVRPYDENILTERIGLIGAVELRPSPLNRMRLSVNQSGETQRIERRQLSALGSDDAYYRSGSRWEVDRRISLVALEVENNFPNTRLDYQLSFSDTKEELNDRLRSIFTGVANDADAPTDLTPESTFGTPNTEVAREQQNAELEETVAIGSLNVTHWLNPKRTQSLKAGGRYRSKDRAYGVVERSVVPAAPREGPDGFAPLLEKPVVNDAPAPNSDEGRIYDAKQRIAAAYLMYTANLNARFSLNAGVRYEYLEVETRDARDTIAFDESDLLPSVNLTYRIRRDRQIRLGVYQALGRPSYANFRPGNEAIGLFPFEQYNVANRELEPTNSTNIDLTFERYGRRDGLLSLGLYGKWIASPTLRLTEYNFDLTDPRYTTRTVNTDDASVLGLEAGLYQNLGAIREGLRFFNVNGTFSYNLLSVDNPDGISDDLPLARAPRLAGNLSLVYNNPNRELNVVAAVNYRDRFLDRIYNSQALWRNNFLSLDLSADYEFVKNVSVFTRLNNLTDHAYEEWLGKPDDEGSVLRSRAFYGAWGLVGVRYRP